MPKYRVNATNTVILETIINANDVLEAIEIAEKMTSSDFTEIDTVLEVLEAKTV